MITKDKLHHIRLTNNWYLYLDTFGRGFAGGFTLLPSIVIRWHKGYKQASFVWLNGAYDVTLLYYKK